MKFTVAIATILGTFVGNGGAISAQQLPDTPYKLVFYYTDQPSTGCDCNTDFFRIVDSVYQEYAHELVFTTSVNYSDIDKLDPRWNKVAGFYESRSKNPEKYRSDYDIWSGRDKYSVDGHYDTVDLVYTDPLKDLKDTPSTPVSADTRAKFAVPFVSTYTADNSGALTDGDLVPLTDDNKGDRRKLRGLASSSSSTNCGLQMSIGRSKLLDCETSIDTATGSKTNIDTLKQGSGVAELFYENIDLYLMKSTFAPEECHCQEKLNSMKYAVVEIKL